MDDEDESAHDFGAHLQTPLTLARAQGHVPIVANQTLPEVLDSIRRDRAAAQDRRVTLVLENANLRDDIARRMPKTGYIGADWQGRIALHPLLAKEYLAWTKRCRAHLAEDARNTVSITQGQPMNAAQFQAEWRHRLDKRINLAGHVTVREPRDGGWTLRRDQRAIEDHLQRRIRMHYLGSRLVKKRLPDLAALANNRRNDYP